MANKDQVWSELWWPAPAKLNLMLRITGRRDDGYHDLQTVFQLIAVCDWLNFVVTDDKSIRLVDGLVGVENKTNLVIKAAKLLQEKTEVKLGVDINLKKVLPMGAGLGGGSSDAATTLMVLNFLWGTGLSIDELAELGLSLGADVPVFIKGSSAWAEGVGDKITPISLPERWYLVVNPEVHSSTKEIFTHNRLTRDSSAITIRDFLEGQTQNDCLSVVREINKEFDRIYQQFSGFEKVFLTGTGSSMFAVFDNRQAVVDLQAKLPKNWNMFIAQGVNESPLHTVLNNLKNQV